jgi:hypothetical protein
MSARQKEMSKTNRAMYVAVLEALRAHDCITGYTIAGQGVMPEWKEGGIDRALQELTTNPKPFGLRRSQRAGLLMVLPAKDRERFDATLMRGLRERYGL